MNITDIMPKGNEVPKQGGVSIFFKYGEVIKSFIVNILKKLYQNQKPKTLG